MDLVDLLLEDKLENEKYYKDPIFFAKKIKSRAQELLGKVEVYLFGSIVRGDYTPSSDIDILIVTETKVPPEERGKIRAEILKSVGFFSPFEIHLITRPIFENWYKKFIKENYIKINS